MKPELTVDANGTKHWQLNGKYHRTDGPAYECLNAKFWYINNRLHRIDGPACEYSDGLKNWYIKGNPLTEQQWLSKVLFDNVKISLI